jgi:hypothetical protein
MTLDGRKITALELKAHLAGYWRNADGLICCGYGISGTRVHHYAATVREAAKWSEVENLSLRNRMSDLVI